MVPALQRIDVDIMGFYYSEIRVRNMALRRYWAGDRRLNPNSRRFDTSDSCCRAARAFLVGCHSMSVFSVGFVVGHELDFTLCARISISSYGDHSAICAA
jgi:hypothetical protein